MILGISAWAVVLIGLIVLVGSFVQATVGLGLGLLGAPLIALVEPTLVPTMLLLLAVPVSAGVVLVERHHVDWRAVAWALPPRVPGTALGVWLATAFSTRALGVVVGALVLVAVWFAFHTVEVVQTPATLAVAGFVAGTTGTAAAIGGPPIAIVMAHRPQRQARGTMSVFFLAGSLMSALWFWVQGELPRSSVLLGLAYLPLVGLASLAGPVAARRIPRESFRRAVLALCAVSASVLLVKSLVG